MSNSVISYCLFCYNQQQFVQQAIQSAFDQTYSPLEIIISDDCSTDNTVAIVDEMIKGYSGQHKIIFNRNIANLGCIPHVNKIMSLATGDLVVMAAGDDVAVPNRVEVICAEWRKHGFCDGVFHSNAYRMDMQGREMEPYINRLCRPEMGIDSILGMDKQEWSVLGASIAFTKSIYLRFGDFRHICFGEDFPLAFRGILANHFIHINEKLVYWRQGSGVSTKHVDETIRERMCKMALRRLSYYPQYFADIEKIDNEDLRKRIGRKIKTWEADARLHFTLISGTFHGIMCALWQRIRLGGITRYASTMLFHGLLRRAKRLLWTFLF